MLKTKNIQLERFKNRNKPRNPEPLRLFFLRPFQNEPSLRQDLILAQGHSSREVLSVFLLEKGERSGALEFVLVGGFGVFVGFFGFFVFLVSGILGFLVFGFLVFGFLVFWCLGLFSVWLFCLFVCDCFLAWI